MSKKQEFIKMVECFLSKEDEVCEDYNYAEAIEYFETLKIVKETTKQEITENGKNIIVYMKENEDRIHNLFSAKDIAEGLFVSSRAISGAMRKLANDGFVEKSDTSPIVYSITDKGRNLQINS